MQRAPRALNPILDLPAEVYRDPRASETAPCGFPVTAVRRAPKDTRPRFVKADGTERPMELHRCDSREDYLALVNGPALTVRWLLEHHLASRRGESVVVPGFCAPCVRAVDFVASFDGAWQGPDGTLVPNWRDYLRCPTCAMNGRQRRVAQLIIEWVMDLRCRDRLAGYAMERISPLYSWSVGSFPWIEWTGSEYLGLAKTPGREENGIRHEDA